jgi:hypothetical protein
VCQVIEGTSPPGSCSRFGREGNVRPGRQPCPALGILKLRLLPNVLAEQGINASHERHCLLVLCGLGRGKIDARITNAEESETKYERCTERQMCPRTLQLHSA